MYINVNHGVLYNPIPMHHIAWCPDVGQAPTTMSEPIVHCSDGPWRPWHSTYLTCDGLEFTEAANLFGDPNEAAVQNSFKHGEQKSRMT